jgi:CheY-like chemotaxis protein
LPAQAKPASVDSGEDRGRNSVDVSGCLQPLPRLPVLPDRTAAPTDGSHWSSPARPGDDLNFDAEPHGSPKSAAVGRPWVVLVVDDDRDVHYATRLALTGERVHGRLVEVVSAYSAAEARMHLDGAARFDLLLLDIVMESPDAGVQLARELAVDGRHAALRVLVRTGQPGLWQDEVVGWLPGVHGYIDTAGLTRRALLEALAALLPAAR